jgi:hypothetical protein
MSTPEHGTRGIHRDPPRSASRLAFARRKGHAMTRARAIACFGVGNNVLRVHVPCWSDSLNLGWPEENLSILTGGSVLGRTEV